jgi:hypothetical protein
MGNREVVFPIVEDSEWQPLMPMQGIGIENHS